MKGGVHIEALVFAFAWALVAMAGWTLAGWRAGLALSVGLLLIISPTSMFVLHKTGSFEAERTVRWGLLGAAAVMLLILVAR